MTTTPQCITYCVSMNSHAASSHSAAYIYVYVYVCVCIYTYVHLKHRQAVSYVYIYSNISIPDPIYLYILYMNTFACCVQLWWFLFLLYLFLTVLYYTMRWDYDFLTRTNPLKMPRPTGKILLLPSRDLFFFFSFSVPSARPWPHSSGVGIVDSRRHFPGKQFLIVILKRCVRGSAAEGFRTAFWRKKRLSVWYKLVALAGVTICCKAAHWARRGKEVVPFVLRVVELMGSAFASRPFRNSSQNLLHKNEITHKPNGTNNHWLLIRTTCPHGNRQSQSAPGEAKNPNE